jgi:hypothetical protein
MKTNHTPGPWHFDNLQKLWASNGDWPLAELKGGALRSDMALIAAAPELLAALSDLLNATDTYPANYAHASAFDKAHAAIAKAKGE